jgi:hypothetical protein
MFAFNVRSKSSKKQLKTDEVVCVTPCVYAMLVHRIVYRVDARERLLCELTLVFPRFCSVFWRFLALVTTLKVAPSTQAETQVMFVSIATATATVCIATLGLIAMITTPYAH